MSEIGIMSSGIVLYANSIAFKAIWGKQVVGLCCNSNLNISHISAKRIDNPSKHTYFKKETSKSTVVHTHILI